MDRDLSTLRASIFPSLISTRDDAETSFFRRGRRAMPRERTMRLMKMT